MEGGGSAPSSALAVRSAGSSASTSLPPNSLFPLFSEKKNAVEPLQILLELDRGLRSEKSGEQVEAVIFFGRLLSSFPWPIIVNTAALKLSYLFRTGTNFVRYCICLILRRSESQLSNILSIEDVLRRIHSVLQSNDPIARALTLRTLSSVPHLVANHLLIQHGIRNCLGSYHELELQATLFAMDRICAHSPVFATSVIDQLATRIHALTTPPETKLTIIRIFRHMHHDAQMSAKARTICTQLLDVFPTKEFVLTTLDTLSCLSHRSLLNVPSQIELLLKYLKEDPRLSAKLLCLSNLNKFAARHSTWITRTEDEDHDPFRTSDLIDMLSRSAYTPVLRSILVLLRTLSKQYDSPFLRKAQQQSSSLRKEKENDKEKERGEEDELLALLPPPFDVLEELMYHHDKILSALAAEVVTTIFISQPTKRRNSERKEKMGAAIMMDVENPKVKEQEEQKKEETDDPLLYILADSLCTLVSCCLLEEKVQEQGKGRETTIEQEDMQLEENKNRTEGGERREGDSDDETVLKQRQEQAITNSALKGYLTSLTRLVTCKPSVLSDVARMTVSLLPSVSYDSAVLLCKCLLKCCINVSAGVLELHDSKNSAASILLPYLPHLTSYVLKCLSGPSVLPSSLLHTLFRVFFIAYGNTKQQQCDPMKLLLPLTEELLRKNDNYDWSCFMIGRHAFCHAYHALSSDIFEALSQRVESEFFFYWLKALAIISEAETNASSFLCRQTNNQTSASSSEAMSGNIITMDNVLVSLHRAQTLIKSAVTPSSPLYFQQHYLELRTNYLQTLITTLAVIREIPLQAPLSRYLSSSARSAANMFLRLAETFANLKHSFFDIDQSSYLLLEAHTTACSILAFLMEMLAEDEIRKASLPQAFGTEESSSAQPPLYHACSRMILKLYQHRSQEQHRTIHGSFRSISLSRLDCAKYLEEIVYELLCKVPACYPPYFFCCKPSISVQLSTTLQSKTVTQSVGTIHQLSSTSGLVLDISGLIVNAAPAVPQKHSTSSSTCLMSICLCL
ncbi:Integrator complex subunit 7, variant 2 [Balamuthia mandrillaris]